MIAVRHDGDHGETGRPEISRDGDSNQPGLFLLKKDVFYLSFGRVILMVSRRTSSSIALIESVCSPAARSSAV